jgi:hypothetical protein
MSLEEVKVGGKKGGVLGGMDSALGDLCPLILPITSTLLQPPGYESF